MIKSCIGKQPEIAPPAPQAPFVVKLLIVGFALGYMTAALYMVVDCWVLGQETLKNILGFPADKDLPVIFVSAIYAVLGAVLGAGVLDIVSFHRYVSVKRDFQAQHVWGYFVAPWLAAVLGLIVFALLQSGLLVFTGGTASGEHAEISNLGYLAVGFLSGFGWVQAIERIRDIVSRFFAPSSKEPTAQQPSTVIPANGDTPDKPKPAADSAKPEIL